MVGIYWVNFNGQYVLFSQLKPIHEVVVNTFKTHPWIFKDMRTGERLHVNHDEVFWPKPWWYSNINVSEMAIRRDSVTIHFPVKSLRELTIYRIIRCLLGNRHTPRKITEKELNALELPEIIVNDIRRRYLEIKEET